MLSLVHSHSALWDTYYILFKTILVYRLQEDGCRVAALECMNRQVTPRVHPITERIRQHGKTIFSFYTHTLIG